VPPTPADDSAEVALVGGEEIEAVVPFGQHNAGSVSQVESRQVRLAAEQGSSPRQVVSGNPLDQVGGFDLFERGELPLASEAVEDEVVLLGEDQRRDDERTTSHLHGFEKKLVVVLIAVEDRQQPTGVHDERQRSER
jgi:hypothetical protein